MSEINSQNGQEIYESLLGSWSDYWGQWKCAPDILFINAKNNAELFKWSALGGHQILFLRSKQYIFNAEINPIVDLSLGFIWLEKDDINDALKNKTNFVEKITNFEYEVVDGVTPETQKERIIIPNEVLNIFR